MEQHTPGPWKPINSDGGKPAHVTSADGRIANVHWQGGAEQSNANARLIAAAPGLLAVITDELEYLLDEKQGDELVPLQLDVRINNLKTAIKATK